MYLNAKFEAAAGFAPSAAELEAFVTGAGGVRLGMAENEVTAALGKNPTRREVASSPGAATEVAWEDIPGARPGAAHGRLADGRLVFIEFTTAKLSLPRVSRAVARSLTESADLVRRSVAKSLRMQDIEVITHTPGQRVKWSIGLGDPTTVVSYWLWEVEPGGEALFVEEENGVAGQPITRPLR
jgi:hypothetical protein